MKSTTLRKHQNNLLDEIKIVDIAAHDIQDQNSN